MFKKLPTAITLLAAIAIPTIALAEEKKAGVEKEGNRYQVTTPEVTTTRGSENPPTTDVGDLSRKSRRDFVKDPTGINGAANLGFGLGDSYGVGLGARLGYTFPQRLYVGGNLGYYVGQTMENQGISISNKTWHLGPEVGYDLGVGRFIVRPVLGLGLAFKNQDLSAPREAVAAAGVDTSETNTRVYVAPGVNLNYPIGNFFVGADSRAMLMSGNSTVTFMGALGAHL